MTQRQRMAAAEGRVPWAEAFRRLTFGDVSTPRRASALAALKKQRETGRRRGQGSQRGEHGSGCTA